MFDDEKNKNNDLDYNLDCETKNKAQNENEAGKDDNNIIRNKISNNEVEVVRKFVDLKKIVSNTWNCFIKGIKR